MPASIITNAVVATSGRILNVALGLVAIKLMTGVLGPSGYGAYALLLSFGTILQLIADGGLYLQLTRSIAQMPQRAHELTNNILSLRLLLLAIVFIGGAGLLKFFPQVTSLTRSFLIIAIGLSFQSLSQLCLGIFQYHQVVWRATVGDLLGRVMQIMGIICFAALTTSISGMVSAFAIGAAAAWVLHQLLLPGRRPRLTGSWSAWKDILTSSWPLGALLVLNAIYFRIDTVVLSFFRSPAEVGWYSLAYRIIESALFFPAMFGGLILPRLSEAVAQGNHNRLRQFLTQSLGLQAVAVGLVVVTLLARAPAVIAFIADDAFGPAAPSLQLLSVALGIMFFGNVFGFAMIALHQQTSLLKMYSVLALANTLGNIVLIPQWGMAAAAGTTVVTEAIALLSAAWIIRQHTSYTLPRRSVVGALLAAGTAAVVYAVLPPAWPLLIQIGIATSSYSLVILATRSLTAEQMSLLRT